jgi:hypothetical protein
MGYAFTIVRGWAFKTTTRSTFRSTEHSIGFRFYTLSSHSKFTNRNSHLVSFELRFFISSEITGSFTEMDTTSLADAPSTGCSMEEGTPQPAEEVGRTGRTAVDGTWIEVERGYGI